MATTVFTTTPGVPVVALAAVTATGTSIYFAPPRSVSGSPATITWQTFTTGSPSGISCTLKASLDGANFDTVDTSTSTTGEIRFLANSPAALWELSLDTLSGGTVPTFTALIMFSNV